ncbi:DUF4339 domain-containing protein [Flavobacterium zepuense]|uniref:DUF4339 domain-containing protein n=1 Tax=Flavobacterium zepuense TaxID=2593302 RepID=A0A552V2L7_9FLAO|nr:GYF domain-containing protein [Flavobacterium zepuense]TRW24712.1 DUF4339 domain-containing protein [Flavobacterium zepuense]
MKQYYIYLDDQQVGPLTTDELQQHKITAETMIWFEGLTDWQKANTIEDLKSLFKAIPPPIHKVVATSPPPQPIPQIQYTAPSQYDEDEPSKILGIRKNIFMYCVLGIAFIICISAFSSYNNEEAQKEEQLNSYNEKLKEQEQAIKEQNERIAEQERIEKERIIREKEIARQKRITEISDQLIVAYQNLDKAKRQLNDATAFKLLRSSGERHRQISAAEEQVTIWQGQINELESEMRKINP